MAPAPIFTVFDYGTGLCPLLVRDGSGDRGPNQYRIFETARGHFSSPTRFPPRAVAATHVPPPESVRSAPLRRPPHLRRTPAEDPRPSARAVAPPPRSSPPFSSVSISPRSCSFSPVKWTCLGLMYTSPW